MHPRPFFLQFQISQPYFLIFLRASSSTQPPAKPDLGKEITEKHRRVLVKREHIFDDGILMMWQDTNSNWNSHKYAHTDTVTHTHTHSGTPGNDGSWLSVGKEGVEGTEDATSESFKSYDTFMRPALKIGRYIAQTHTLTHHSSGRYVWLNNKFLYTAHDRLQTKYTDRC